MAAEYSTQAGGTPQPSSGYPGESEPYKAARLRQRLREKIRGQTAGPSADRPLPEFAKSLTRVVKLQLQIWVAHVKVKAARTAILMALFGVAGVLGVLAIIFLYVGVFHLLTDIAHIEPTWVYLIYFGFHALLLGIVVGIAVSKLRSDGGKK